jgi:hypothetical protein
VNLLWRAILSVGGGNVIVGSGPAWAGACASSSFFLLAVECRAVLLGRGNSLWFLHTQQQFRRVLNI